MWVSGRTVRSWRILNDPGDWNMWRLRSGKLIANDHGRKTMVNDGKFMVQKPRLRNPCENPCAPTGFFNTRVRGILVWALKRFDITKIETICKLGVIHWYVMVVSCCVPISVTRCFKPHLVLTSVPVIAWSVEHDTVIKGDCQAPVVAILCDGVSVLVRIKSPHNWSNCCCLVVLRLTSGYI